MEEVVKIREPKPEQWIPPGRCVPGHAYRIEARNGGVGICERVREEIRFRLARYKFGQRFVDSEIHWDMDDHYGTAKPLRDLGEAPSFPSEKEELAWLLQKEKEFREKEVAPCLESGS